MGYFEHRGNGKRWLEDQEDMDAMYRAFSGGEDVVTLWVNGLKSKRQGVRKSDEIEDPPARQSKRADKEEKIDAIVQQLRTLHDEKFSGPQMRLWARMKINGQHDLAGLVTAMDAEWEGQ